MRSTAKLGRRHPRVAKIGRALIIGLLWVSSAMAEPTVEMVVEPTIAPVGEEIVVQVTLRGAQRAPEPQIDGLAGFDVQKAGSSNQVQIINGVTSLSVIYNYALMPRSAGTFTIGPARVTLGGRTYQSEAVTIRVTAGGSHAAATADRPFLMHAEVDHPQAYVNQQVIYTFQFLSRGEIHNARLNLPEFQGFLKEDLGKQRNYEAVRDGVRWAITEIRVALFPTRTGDISLAPATLVGEAVVDNPRRRRGSPLEDFFDNGMFSGGAQVKQVRLQSPGMIVKVSPLPTVGKPLKVSGVVGQLSVRQALSKDTVAVGDSVTWTVEISGQGNIRDVRWESSTPAGFKAYDDQPGFVPLASGVKAGGTKTFKKALVPLEKGTHTIAPLEISYFDPEKGGYRIAQAPALRLEVTPGTGVGVTASGTNREAVAVRGEDILAPRWKESAISVDALTRAEWWRLVIMAALGPILFALAYAVATWRRRRGLDPARNRRQTAYGSFRRAATGADSLDGLDGALREYLGNRFNTDGGALTPLDIREKLPRWGVPPDWAREAESVLDQCERARYGGGGDSSELKNRILRLVDGLEKEIRT